MNKWYLGIVAGVLVLLLVVAGFLHTRRPAPYVPMLTVSYAPFTIELPESGVVQYPQVQTMSSKIAANIGRIYVKPGDRVSAGQLLVTIENPLISSTAQSTEAAYRSATAKAASAQVTGSSNVVQAQANLESARARLAQAQQDLVNGLQSGLGYGETTAAEQRTQANATFATAATSLHEARRIFFAYRDLYAEKAVSRDQLAQEKAKYDQAQVAYDQAAQLRASLGTQLVRSRTVLEDNLRSAQQGFAQAQAQLTAARVQASNGDVAAAQAEATRAGSEYTFAQEQADAMQIRAPYNATVLSIAKEKNDPLRPLQPGDAVDAMQPLITLAARRDFLVRTKVDEQDVINVHIGQAVRITGDDFPGRTLTGRVVEISPVADRHTVATTIAIDRAPAFLRDGMSVEAHILTTNLAHALVVPNDAIASQGGAAYVYVVRNGDPHRQTVRTGLSNETHTVIESGLRQGDVIVAQIEVAQR